jgi:protocatechuate 3,4-dioxygenase beta subunit
MKDRHETSFIGARAIAVLALILLEWFSPGPIAFAEQLEDAISPERGGYIYIVTGHVTDGDGHSIGGATVEYGSGKTRFNLRHQTTTDKEGAYSLVIKSIGRENHLAASAPGCSTEVSDAGFEPGRQTRDFVLHKLSAEQHVAAGTVVDELGVPIAGVRVEAFTPVQGFISSFSMPTGRDYFAGPERVDITDSQGRFRIADLPTDEVQLNLQSKHRHVNDSNYPVKVALRIAMSGSGQPGVIQGRVVDATTNRPPQSVRDIRIVPRYSTANYACSGDDGRFQLRTGATLREKYIVYVYAKGYAAARGELMAEPSDSEDFTDIKLTKQPALRGKVIDATTGQPVKAAPLLYGVAKGSSYVEWSDLQKYADGYHPLNFVQHVSTNEAGEFWFAEPEGGLRGMIIVFVPGYQRLILKPNAREVDAATGDVVVRMKRESAFSGVLTKDGKPLPNVSVGVSMIRQSTNPSEMPESVRSDAHGKYTYGRLLPGQYRIYGGPYTRLATVGDGETATVNLGGDLGEICIHGKATPDISISVHPAFDWDYSNLTTKANAEGEYELCGLKPGKYQVSMDGGFQNGFHSRRKTIEIEVDQDGQEIDLRPADLKR